MSAAVRATARDVRTGQGQRDRRAPGPVAVAVSVVAAEVVGEGSAVHRVQAPGSTVTIVSVPTGRVSSSTSASADRIGHNRVGPSCSIWNTPSRLIARPCDVGVRIRHRLHHPSAGWRSPSVSVAVSSSLGVGVPDVVELRELTCPSPG